MGISLELYRSRIGRYNRIKFITSPGLYLADFLYPLLLLSMFVQGLLCMLIMVLTILVIHGWENYVKGLCERTTVSHTLYFWLITILLLKSNDVESNPGPSSELTLMHSNVRSLLSTDEKLSEIKTLADALSLDVISLSETWLKPNTTNESLLFDNFNDLDHIFRRDRQNRVGGGVITWVRNNLYCRRLVELESPYTENVWTQITKSGKTILLGVYYRPPVNTSSAIQTFIDDFESSINKARKLKFDSLIVMGDFNAKNISWFNLGSTDSCGQKLGDCLENLSLHQLVQSPTHYGLNGTLSLLDLLITDSPNLFTISGPGTPLPLCDHCPIFCQFFVGKAKSRSYTRQMWFYNQIDENKLEDIFSSIPWNICFDLSDNPSDIYKNWNTTFLDAINDAIPNKTVRIFPENVPWYRKEHHIMRREVHGALKKAAKSQSIDHWNKFKIIKNRYTALCRYSKTNHSDKLFNILVDGELCTRTWWNAMKQTLGRKVCNFIPPLIKNDTIANSAVDKATIFNQHFVSITKVDDTYATIPPIGEVAVEKLTTASCTPSQINKFINNMNANKSCGADGITARMLKLTSTYISEPLSRIVNLSIANGIYPCILKLTNVFPLFKAGDKHDFKNYRPIALLSLVGKLFERVVFLEIYNFLESKNFFSTSQSGFRKKDSTTCQLIDIVNKIAKGLQNNEETIAISLDISKAFDRVWHRGLIYKLKRAGIDGKLLEWIKSYLEGRKQRVCIDGNYSEWEYIEAGVPQGSILGPLLFLIYINDLPEGIQSEIKLFADDTFLFNTTKDIQRGIATLNQDLNRIETWAKQWLVTMNPQKTKAILFSNKRTPSVVTDLKMHNTDIQMYSSFKHLGLMLDSKLTWKNHVEYITKKANKSLSSIHRLKSKLPSKILLTAYKSMVRPIVEYADVVWSGCGTGLQCALESIQYRAMLSIAGAIKSTDTGRLRTFLGLQSLRERRESHRLCLLFKILKGNSPLYLHNMVSEYMPNRQYNVRDPTLLNIPRATNQKYRKSFIIATISSWNKLPRSYRESNCTHQTFSKLLWKSQGYNPTAMCTHFYGNRKAEKLTNRFILGFTGLNNDLFSHNIIESPFCQCQSKETREHFISTCPLYTNIRNIMLTSLTLTHERLTEKQTLKAILTKVSSEDHASASTSCIAFQTYLIDSTRFD